MLKPHAAVTTPSHMQGGVRSRWKLEASGMGKKRPGLPDRQSVEMDSEDVVAGSSQNGRSRPQKWRPTVLPVKARGAR